MSLRTFLYIWRLFSNSDSASKFFLFSSIFLNWLYRLSPAGFASSLLLKSSSSCYLFSSFIFLRRSRYAARRAFRSSTVSCLFLASSSYKSCFWRFSRITSAIVRVSSTATSSPRSSSSKFALSLRISIYAFFLSSGSKSNPPCLWPTPPRPNHYPLPKPGSLPSSIPGNYPSAGNSSFGFDWFFTTFYSLTTGYSFTTGLGVGFSLTTGVSNLVNAFWISWISGFSILGSTGFGSSRAIFLRACSSIYFFNSYNSYAFFLRFSYSSACRNLYSSTSR